MIVTCNFNDNTQIKNIIKNNQYEKYFLLFSVTANLQFALNLKYLKRLD